MDVICSTRLIVVTALIFRHRIVINRRVSCNMIANPDISWEKERVFNIGMDAVLLRGLSVEFDYFHKERYDVTYSTIPFVGASIHIYMICR